MPISRRAVFSRRPSWISCECSASSTSSSTCAAGQEDEVGADRPLLCRDGRCFLDQRRTCERLLARPQPLNLQHDHLLAERIAFPLWRQLEAGKRHLTRTRHLHEERVRRSEPVIAGPRVPTDDAIDHRVARLKLHLRKRERGLPFPVRGRRRATLQRDRAFLELELLA